MHSSASVSCSVYCTTTQGVRMQPSATPNSREACHQKDVYSVGYDAPTASFFSDRRAVTHAAFFLPHVRRGMTLLDGGCGPGTITTDLAEAVAPAAVVGIDIEQLQMTQ